MERTSRDVIAWRKSTHSGANGGACVEVGGWCEDGGAATLLVRDTKDRDGTVLRVDHRAWDSFIGTLKIPV